MQKPISITAISSISPLGKSLENAWKKYQNNDHHISEKQFERQTALVSQISEESKQEIETIKASDSKYKSLDNSVLFAIYASRHAIKNANWNASDNFGINIGSSRGATQLFEDFHKDFLQNNKAKTLSSPTTTLGNISSWVAHDLQTQGPEISHSITCSTALHAMLNGIAWINSGMCNKFLVGGSEAPLTPFTVAPMQALKIYSKAKLKSDCHSDLVEESFPCRALDLSKKQQNELKPLLRAQVAEKKAAMQKRKEARKSKNKPTADQIFAMKNKQLDSQIAFKSKMKDILNKEQFEKFEKMKKGRRMKGNKMKKKKKMMMEKKGKKNRKE